MNGPDIDACIQEPLCAKVAMARQVQLPGIAEVAEPPAGAALWSGGLSSLMAKAGRGHLADRLSFWRLSRTYAATLGAASRRCAHSSNSCRRFSKKSMRR